MPSFTKKAIKETFLQLLNERPLNQITVKDIVETCGINRNSFYYHFEDLPALVEEIVQEQVHRLIERHPTIESVEQCFDAVVEFAMQNKQAIYHIFHSLSREVFERYLMEACQHIVTTYIDAEFAARPLKEQDKRVMIRYHKCECFGAVLDWLSSGMQDDIAAYFRRVCELKKGWAEHISQRSMEA